MKKKLFIIIPLIILIIISLIFILKKDKNEKFYLEDKYYNSKEVVQIDKAKYEDLVKNKESFVVFVYQPACYVSEGLERIKGTIINQYFKSVYLPSTIDEIREKVNNNPYPENVKNKIEQITGKSVAFYKGDVCNESDLEAVFKDNIIRLKCNCSTCFRCWS